MLNYAKLASACRTTNQFNRLHIDLECVLTPAEIAEISTQANPLPQTLEWVRTLEALSPELLSRPAAFRRRPISDALTVYENEGTGPAESVLVAFPGDARRLMLPLAIFQQALDPAAWTVLVVKKPKGESLVQGIEGIAPDFPGLVRIIEETIDPGRYRNVVTLGTSGGGFSAAWAGTLLHARKAISVCGAPPEGYSVGGAHRGNEVDIVHVFGEGAQRDSECAEAARRVLGGTLHPVAEIAGHNVFLPLAVAGRFHSFLAELLS